MSKWLGQRFGERKPKIKQLWKREFNTDPLHSLIDRAVIDTEQIVASIKGQAQTEAADKAVRIIDQAKQEADEIRRRAEVAARKETGDILSALNSKTKDTEAEVRQKAQLFLLKAREEIEKEVREEYKQAHSRLLHSLINKSGEAVPSLETSAPTQIEIEPDIAIKGKVEQPVQLQEEAKRKTAEARKAKEAQKQTKKETALTAKINSLKKKLIKPIQSKRAVPVSEPAEAMAEEFPEQAGEEAKLAAGDSDLEERVEQPVKLEKEVTVPEPEEAITEPAEAMAEEFPEQAGEEAKLAAGDSDLEERVEQPVKLEKEVAVPEPEEAITEPAEAIAEELPELNPPEETPGKEEPVSAPIKLDRQALYNGEVELTITVPINPVAMSRLYNHLQTTPEIKILYTSGSWDRGTTIAVTLDKPLPLIDVISKIPGIDVTLGSSQTNNLAKGTSGTLRGTERKEVTRIDLTLKEENPVKK
ncbi:hypothetical protein ACFLTO_01770 [Chloroflexota bacterium]